jgi:hypothetical protein
VKVSTSVGCQHLAKSFANSLERTLSLQFVCVVGRIATSKFNFTDSANNLLRFKVVATTAAKTLVLLPGFPKFSFARDSQYST